MSANDHSGSAPSAAGEWPHEGGPRTVAPTLSATWQEADQLRARGDFAAARDLLEPAADVAAIRLGPDDPDVIETMRRLATAHRELGELASARRVLEEALDGGLLRLGDAHPVILMISAELGAIADELGNKHEARRNLARVARHGPDVLGPDHPYVRTALRYLGLDVPPPSEPEAPAEPEPGPDPEPTWAAPTPIPVEAGVYRPATPWTAPAEETPPWTVPPQDPAPPWTVPQHARPEPDEAGPGDRQDAPEEPARRGGPLLALAIVAAAAVLAAGGVVIYSQVRDGPSTPAAAGSPSTGASSAVRTAPTGVKLRDDGVTVTLTWVDPSGGSTPFIVAGGRAGEQSRAFQSLPAGTTAYTVSGLNPGVDYCFTVVAVYGTDAVAPSDLVCTRRSPASPTK